MSKNGTMDTKAHAERLVCEAVALYEQGRLEEALLACEGALALDETYAPALSLKGLIHERRGQVAEAIAAYERVQAVNPLSVAERARLDALRRQARAVVRPAPARPLWVETLPVVLAFLGVGLVLLIGFALILRWSAPPAPSQPVAPTAESIPPPASPPPSATVSAPPAETPSPNPPQAVVPPVMIDPSRLALAPAQSNLPRGEIPTLPAPETETKPAPKTETPKPNAERPSDSEVMPDVKVEETQRGVYEIRVERAPSQSPSRGATTSRATDALTQAQDLQRAGNYREAIQAYLQALPTAPNPAEVHQQIAICYLRLGDKANARTHFLQAIAGYERQIQAGRDVETARQGIAACQNGLLLCNE